MLSTASSLCPDHFTSLCPTNQAGGITSKYTRRAASTAMHLTRCRWLIRSDSNVDGISSRTYVPQGGKMERKSAATDQIVASKGANFWRVWLPSRGNVLFV